MKRLRPLAVLAALCGTVVLAGWVGAGLAGLGSLGIESTGAPIDISRGTSATARAEKVTHPRATAPGGHGASVAYIASGSAALSDPPPMPRPAIPVAIGSFSTPVPKRSEVEAAGSVEVPDTGSGSAALSDPPPKPQLVRPPVLIAAVSPTDPVQDAARPAAGSEPVDACAESDVCIDQYLWSLYERTPKVDTVKLEERIKEEIKTKGKTKTVVKTLTKYLTEDFGWKDPKAAQKAGMSLKDYVIGGMDRDFRVKLYNALRVMDDAGLSPGITSGFRDDYRQQLATGNKAAPDSSYHGGSRRGGYGHGLAADLVSVKGETRAERCTWSELLWKWIDAHEKELGIGRPYLDKDPPHVGPIDGKEYADKRSAAKAQLAGLKPSPSIEAKERAGKSSAAKAQFAGLQKPSPSIEAKDHADKRSAAKAQLAGLKTPSPSIEAKDHADKRSAAKERFAGLKTPSRSIEAKDHADKRSAAKAQFAGLKTPSPSSQPK
jgi:hypothetical protein